MVKRGDQVCIIQSNVVNSYLQGLVFYLKFNTSLKVFFHLLPFMLEHASYVSEDFLVKANNLIVLKFVANHVTFLLS